MIQEKKLTVEEIAEELIKFVAIEQRQPYKAFVKITPRQVEHITQVLLSYAAKAVEEHKKEHSCG